MSSMSITSKIMLCVALFCSALVVSSCNEVAHSPEINQVNKTTKQHEPSFGRLNSVSYFDFTIDPVNPNGANESYLLANGYVKDTLKVDLYVTDMRFRDSLGSIYLKAGTIPQGTIFYRNPDLAEEGNDAVVQACDNIYTHWRVWRDLGY